MRAENQESTVSIRARREVDLSYRVRVQFGFQQQQYPVPEVPGTSSQQVADITKGMKYEKIEKNKRTPWTRKPRTAG